MKYSETVFKAGLCLSIMFLVSLYVSLWEETNN